MDITTGSAVLSLKGHDRGMLFAVVGFADDEHALLADGKARKVQKPKKKKQKHMQLLGTLNLPDLKTVTNRQLRQALREFSTGAAHAEGGR